MGERTYSFDAAAGLLGLGRNTLIRRLRELGLIGQDNLPAGRERGGPHFRVIQRMYHHPVRGWTPYGRTEITRRGLHYIAEQLGLGVAHPPENSRHPQNHANLGANPRSDEIMSETYDRLPEGILHDVGELTVVTEDGDRIHHRAAMVLVFDSPSALQRAIDAHRCAYRIRRDLPEERLHPERTAQ